MTIHYIKKKKKLKYSDKYSPKKKVVKFCEKVLRCVKSTDEEGFTREGRPSRWRGRLHEPAAPFLPWPCWAVGREGQASETPGRGNFVYTGINLGKFKKDLRISK